MPRAKNSVASRRRRKKVLKSAKGYWGAKSKLYRTAHEAMMKSLSYAYRDRRARKRDFRNLWITRIGIAVRNEGMPYNKFIKGLKDAGVEINRKILAELAVNDHEAFTNLVKVSKESMN
ncbi:MAG: 50S ribosomal protein L20 [Candidatus Atribacteria bacterium]|nr:50S ribosomal protein L20 [Candidatus Atribacteria bacterium]MCK4308619.1 50S ribosomal protein L20 [Candidatus Atribacteria bacterium]